MVPRIPNNAHRYTEFSRRGDLMCFSMVQFFVIPVDGLSFHAIGGQLRIWLEQESAGFTAPGVRPDCLRVAITHSPIHQNSGCRSFPAVTAEASVLATSTFLLFCLLSFRVIPTCRDLFQVLCFCSDNRGWYCSPASQLVFSPVSHQGFP